MCGAEYWILQSVIRYTWNVLKCGALENWVDCARNKGLHRSNEERYILQGVKNGKNYRIGYILRRNCLLKHFIAGKIQGRVDSEVEVSSSSMTFPKTRRKRGSNPWRPRFGRGYISIVKQSR